MTPFKSTYRILLLIISVCVIVGCSHKWGLQSVKEFTYTPSTPAVVPIIKDSIAEPPKIIVPVEVPMEQPLPLFKPFTKNQTLSIRIADSVPTPQGEHLDALLKKMSAEIIPPLKGQVLHRYDMKAKHPHTGIDLHTNPNDTVRVIAHGIVRLARYYSGYGNIIIVRHENNLETLYAHHRLSLVKPNDIVRAGTPIAVMGMTDRNSTPHLHFELRAGSQPIDPERLIRSIDN